MQNKIIIDRKTGVIIPDMASFIRDVTEKGNIGALLGRLLKVGIGGMLTLAWWNWKNVLHLAKMEFAYGVLLLTQIEILNLKGHKFDYIILSDQITDLSVALKTKVIIKSATGTINKIMPKVKVGVMTNNFVRSIEQFYEWGLKLDIIITPINVSGYEMNPTQKEVEEVIKMNDREKIVALVNRKGKRDGVYLKKLGIKNSAYLI